jgi:hypothetical protein
VAAARAVEVLRAVCAEGADLDEQVARVDLAVDFQGYQPTPAEAGDVVSRVRKSSRAAYHAVDPSRWWPDEGAVQGEARRVLAIASKMERAKAVDHRRSLLAELFEPEGGELVAHGDATTFTGFAFGRGALSARLYDKTRELSVSRKQWFRTLWARAGGPGVTATGDEREGPGAYDAEAPVWRLEFQVRREGLRQFRPLGEGVDFTASTLAKARAGSWPEVARFIEGEGPTGLWGYLSQEWLSFRDTRAAATRQTYRAWWRALQRGWRGGAGDGVALWRDTVADAFAVVVPGLAGYLSSAVGQVQAVREAEGAPALPYSQALVAAVAAAHSYRAAKGDTVHSRATERSGRLAARRRQLCEAGAVTQLLAGVAPGAAVPVVGGHSRAVAALRAASQLAPAAHWSEATRYAPALGVDASGRAVPACCAAPSYDDRRGFCFTCGHVFDLGMAGQVLAVLDER